jgi:hypothetical protein
MFQEELAAREKPSRKASHKMKHLATSCCSGRAQGPVHGGSEPIPAEALILWMPQIGLVDRDLSF